MRGTVLAALLGLCASLAAGKQVVVLKDLDFVKFSGLWYEIAFASEAEPPGSPQKPIKMGAVVVEPEGGRLALTTVYDNKSLCVKEKSLAQEGDTPGKFRITKDTGSREVSVVATDYKTYAVMDIVRHTGAASHRDLKLYSRDLKHSEEALRSFRQAAQERGLSPRDVHLLAQDMTCVDLLRTELI
uniref:Lipocalin 8 n=1 Tax=Rousettus aegyptiacus TaxID=9407 RepID=A0A7J8IKV3_ROUAE|nr:lipocalin 8 [Rousettus aegyptiacus]